MLGYQGCNPEYLDRKPSETVELEPLPDEVAAGHYADADGPRP
ncbi:hypothetical protein [Streptomyces sp. NPDC059010]